MPLIAFNMSRTDPMVGGWIWMGGRLDVIFPLEYKLFIFFWRKTACWVNKRKHSDDSLVFSWVSPSYFLENHLFKFYSEVEKKQTHLRLVDCVSFFFIIQSRTEVSHAALSSCNQVVTHSDFEGCLAIVLDVQSQSVFQETQWKLVFSNSMQN